ncbi:MAG: type II toxin-antitoxin system YafQ family toxin [Candidatus Gracilibacteria bacterium]|jgi:mRNA interferase YafQ
MRTARTTNRFQKDYAKLKKSGGKNMQKLQEIMEKLIDGEILEPKYKDHPLQGKWKNFRDCHVENDWILIYKLDKNENNKELITFCATDNHSNLFE